MLKRILQHITGGTRLSQRAECHPAGCEHPGISLVQLDYSVVTVSSFVGMQTTTGTRFLPAEVLALKGQHPETQDWLAASPRDIRVREGHLFIVQKVTAGRC